MAPITGLVCSVLLLGLVVALRRLWPYPAMPPGLDKAAAKTS